MTVAFSSCLLVLTEYSRLFGDMKVKKTFRKREINETEDGTATQQSTRKKQGEPG